MPKVKPYKFEDGRQGFAIECPACKGQHQLDGRWTFNGDWEKPTFTPSLHYRCNTSDMKDYRPDCGSTVCHSFIRDGYIDYLNDCTHSMAGQVVPLPEVTIYPWDT